MSNSHSPADVLRHALIQAGLGTLPSANGEWPIYTDHLPDKPDNAICTYDTTGVADGRLMSGQTIRHPGWQVRLRGKTTRAAWVKAREVQRTLDTLRELTVAIAGETYTVASITQTSDVVSLGLMLLSEQHTGREQLTLNGTLTLTN